MRGKLLKPRSTPNPYMLAAIDTYSKCRVKVTAAEEGGKADCAS